VIFSNRCFPTKAVAIWQLLDANQQTQLISSYFTNSGGWESPQGLVVSPHHEFYTDPVHIVTAKKVGASVG